MLFPLFLPPLRSSSFLSASCSFVSSLSPCLLVAASSVADNNLCFASLCSCIRSSAATLSLTGTLLHFRLFYHLDFVAKISESIISRCKGRHHVSFITILGTDNGKGIVHILCDWQRKRTE